MTKEKLFAAVGEVRDEWIADAKEENLRRVTQAKRMRRAAGRIGAFAACLALLLTMGYRVYAWYFMSYSHEQVLRLCPFVLEDRLMMYAFDGELGEGQRLMLGSRRGEYVGQIAWQDRAHDVWKLQGRDDYAELIFSDGDSFQLGHFHQYSALAEGWSYDTEDTDDWWYASLMTPEEWAQIDTSAYTLSEVLETIYCVNSADDIASVRFEKSDIDNTEVGRSVKIKTVTLRDMENLEKIWNILAALAPLSHHAERPIPTVVLPDYVKTVQVVRDITIKLKNGAVLQFEYNPSGGEDCALFYRIEGYHYYYLTPDQNHTLINLAEISFAPTPIPETKPLLGTPETAVAQTVPQ